MSVSITVKDTGRLVEHQTWGRGKILHVAPPYVQIYFSNLRNDAGGPIKKLGCSASQLDWSKSTHDSHLDGVSLGKKKALTPEVKGAVAKTKLAPTHNLQGAIDWFCRTYPRRFEDEKLIDMELDYKRSASTLYSRTLGGGKAEKLVQSGKLSTLAEHLDDISHATNIPSRFEIMAMHDGFKDLNAVANLTSALLAFVKAPTATTFEELIDRFSRLPVPEGGSRVLTWPNVTIFPFLADPTQFMVMKPGASKLIARRMDFELLYSSTPSWHCYEALLSLSKALLEHLKPLGAKDYVDVQSFMWVTKDLA